MSEKPTKDGEITVVRNEKGQIVSGVLNPAGKAPGTKHMSTRLNEMLLETISGDPEGRTYKEMLIKRLITKAIEKADPALINIVLDRVEGKPDQGINMNVSGEMASNSVDVMEIARQVSEKLKDKKTIQ